MINSQDYHGPFIVLKKWDWQPQKLKTQYGQLTLSDVKFDVGKENDLFTRIGIRLNKRFPGVMIFFKNLRSF